MAYKTIAELSKGLAAKKYSSVELTTLFLDRVKRQDKEINSFITVTEEQALAWRAKNGLEAPSAVCVDLAKE